MNACSQKLRLTAAGLLAVALITLGACESPPTAPLPGVDLVRTEQKKDAFAAALLPEVKAYYDEFISREDDGVREIWSGCVRDGRASVVGTAYGVGTHCRIVTADGYPRRFVVYVPDGVKKRKAVPLVLMHHGSSGTGEKFYNISGWKEEADRRRFIVAFPTSLPYDVLGGGTATKWHDYSLLQMIDAAWRPPGYPAASPWPADDVSFIGQLLDDLEAEANIDARRIYSAGFSSGSAFTARLSIEMSDRFAAVAQFAGGLVSEQEPVQRIPVAWLLGSLDDKVIGAVNAMMEPGSEPITELSLDPNEILSYTAIGIGLSATLASFDLDPTPTMVRTPRHRTSFKWRVPLPGNTDGNTVAYGLLEDVAHHYPHNGSPQSLNPWGFSAAELFWDFFRRHPKR